MNREELEGVTSHEMSHIKNHDIRLLLVVSTMIGLAALLASILWRTAFWGSIGDENGGGQFVIVLFAPVPCSPSSALSSARSSAWLFHAAASRWPT
jgi:Zn-dependent protease with chaperone function